MINLDDSTTLGELKQIIIDKEGTGLGDVSVLTYSGKAYNETHDKKTLKDIGVKRMRTVFAIFKLLGGSSTIKPLDTKELKNSNVELSDTKCIVNSSEDKYCKSSNTKRMRFNACKIKDSDECWFCYKCVQYTINSHFSNSRTEFECGRKCGDFDFDTLMLAANWEEKEEEKVLETYDNLLLKKQKIKDCEKCGTFIAKHKGIVGNRVRCPNKKCEYYSKDFCYMCGHEWLNNSNNNMCGREDCADQYYGVVVEQIENCSTKDYTWKIEKGPIKNIPVCRLCTNCNALMAWGSGCKHLTCESCDHGFCFSCLKRWETCRCRYCRNNQGLKSCDLDTICTVAPRQEVPDEL